MLIAVAGLMLSSCAAPDSDVVFGEPTHGPLPEPMIAYDCESLTSDKVFELAFDDVPAPIDPILTEYAGSASIPPAASVRAAGGLACEWGISSIDDYRGVTLRVLPDATEDYWEYADAVYIGSYNDWCYEGAADCGTEAIIRGMWGEATASGGTVQEATVALTNTLVYSVEGATASGVRWLGPEGERRSCDAALTSSLAAQALGVDAEVYVFDAGKSLVATAEHHAGVTSCGVNERDTAIATVSVMPSGSWAWESVLDQVVEDPVSIAGIEKSTIRCNLGAEGCTVDFVHRGDWIRVGTLAGAANGRESAIALAEAIAGQP